MDRVGAALPPDATGAPTLLIHYHHCPTPYHCGKLRATGETRGGDSVTATTREKRSGTKGPIVQKMRCGPCAVGHHASCIARIRNGFSSGGVRRFVDCSCCGAKTPRRCLDCGNPNVEEVHPQLWECTDSLVCLGRQDLRRQNSRTYQMIQAIKSDLAIARRANRQRVAKALSEIPENEDWLLDTQIRPRAVRQRSRTVRPTSGSCLCCNEPTKGGQFLPGHDAKWKSRLRAAAKAGDQQAQIILQDRGWA